MLTMSEADWLSENKTNYVCQTMPSSRETIELVIQLRISVQRTALLTDSSWVFSVHPGAFLKWASKVSFLTPFISPFIFSFDIL
jgi:hypothetical protein